MTVAAVVIAGGKRTALIDYTLDTLRGEAFDDILVVGEYHTGPGYRYLHVPAMTQSTNDALVKRDVGTLATAADILVYLSDDHTVMPGFVATLREYDAQPIRAWDVLVPARYAEHPEHGRIRIPNGEEHSYCAGHGGVFRRRVIRHRPWTAQQHHPNWDLIASHQQLRDGFVFVPYAALGIMDLEPQNAPWH